MILRELQSCLDRLGIVLLTGGDRLYTSPRPESWQPPLRSWRTRLRRWPRRLGGQAGAGERRAANVGIGPSSEMTAVAGRRRSSIPSPAPASTTISIPSRTSRMSSVACRPILRISSMSCCPMSGSPRTHQPGARGPRESTDRDAGCVAANPSGYGYAPAISPWRPGRLVKQIRMRPSLP